MELAWGPEEEAFRGELVAFLDEHAPPEACLPRDFSADETETAGELIPGWAREWQATLFDHGWMIPAYPPELGGRNCTPVQTLVFLEEMARRSILRSLHFPGYAIVAPSLLEFGTEEQKALAPAAIRGDTVWCIGMSEPNAGSDLASIQTRAAAYDDHFVINGQKVWTSYAMVAQKCFCYVRTNPDVPKHRGISLLIVDMDTPGIEIRPIREMTGAQSFNEVFFTDVRIPAENLVGAEHDGWRLGKVTLANERVSLSSGGALWGRGPTAGDLVDLVRRQGGVADPVLRQRLAALHIEASVLDLIRLRTLTARIRGEPPGAEASIRKLLADEHGQRIMALAHDLMGAAGMLTDRGPLGTAVDLWHYGFLFSPALTIGGGTTEVQRNIVAERVLGLPGEPG